MKQLRKIVSVLALLVLLVAAMTACGVSSGDILSPDAEKLFLGTAVYETVLTNSSTGAQTVYPTTFTLRRVGDEITIQSAAELEEASSQEGGKPEKQSMSSTSVLYAEGVVSAQEGAPSRVMMPKTVRMTFRNDAKPKLDVDIYAAHSLNDKEIKLSVTQFENENATEAATKEYLIPIPDQYYDSDSLLWMVSTLPLEVGYSKNLALCSSNRNQLQSMNITVAEEMEYTTKGGQKYNCYVVVVKPNTVFTHFATYVYYAKDYQNIVVAIKQETTSFELTSFTPEGQE